MILYVGTQTTCNYVLLVALIDTINMNDIVSSLRKGLDWANALFHTTGRIRLLKDWVGVNMGSRHVVP